MKLKSNRAAAYKKAGVNIEAKMRALQQARAMIESTWTAPVGRHWGAFGGMFNAPGADMVLVSSIDGVGTKLQVAWLAGRHDTVGEDIVNHCVNDILVQGAEPLFFLDYIGTSLLDGTVFQQVLKGLCRACRANGCALIGGETAEMPGLYPAGQYDLVGVMVGAVPRKKLVTGKGIKAGDVLIGLPSSGLHTNGYSLARHILFEQAGLKVRDRFPGSRATVGEILLAPHKSYLKPIRAAMQKVTVRGLAHITGGGFPDNVARILPPGLSAVVDRTTWTPPALFQFLQAAGKVAREEMYRVFNMGIGMVMIVREREAVEAWEALRGAGEKPQVLGFIEKGPVPVRLAN